MKYLNPDMYSKSQTSQLLVLKWSQFVAHAGVFAHVIRDRLLPQLIALKKLVLLLAALLRCHGQKDWKVLDRCLNKVALEAVAEPGQGSGIGANVTPMEHRRAAFLDDDRNVVAHLQQGLLSMGDIHALHETADGGDEGVVARPEVPVRDSWLASAFTDFTLEFVEEKTWSAD